MKIRPPLVLDIEWRELLMAALDCGRRGNERGWMRRVEHCWLAQGDVPARRGQQGVAALSVRSLFDLLLGALDLVDGDEVIFSAVNVPGMAQLALAHGLVVVPVDIDPETLAPDLAALDRALASPRARIFVGAHLLGSHVDLDGAAALCRTRGVAFVEDCAQAYAADGWMGHPAAVASLFSFGLIKTATALGGAVATVRDCQLARRMRIERDQQPLQPRHQFARRLAVAMLCKGLSSPAIYGALMGVAGWLGFDLRQLLVSATRGFGASCTPKQLARRVRHVPCEGLLRLLDRRLSRPDKARVRRRARAGERLSRAMMARGRIGGFRAPRRTHWVLAVRPVEGTTREELHAEWRLHGYDATHEASSMVAIADRRGVAPPGATELLRDVLFAQPASKT